MAVSTMEAQLNRDATRSDAEGERSAARPDLGELFEAHAPAIYRTILAYTGGRVDLAEEAVGEAFSRAAGSSVRPRDPVAWLYRIAFNVANDELRRERRRCEPADDAVQHPPEVSGVFDALAQLPRRERAAMVLYYVVDLPVADVAARLGIASATVRVHLTRGRRRLAGLLGDDEVEDR